MKIRDFKKGSIITRISPSENGDRSYLGNKLLFIGVANNRIYYKNLTEVSKAVFGEDRIFDLAYDWWQSGWEYYVDPKTLMEGEEFKFTDLSIEQQIERAVEAEDYELAEKLKKQLKND
jgi:hypothetical protein